jgi:hypothetical protein
VESQSSIRRTSFNPAAIEVSRSTTGVHNDANEQGAVVVTSCRRTEEMRMGSPESVILFGRSLPEPMLRAELNATESAIAARWPVDTVIAAVSDAGPKPVVLCNAVYWTCDRFDEAFLRELQPLAERLGWRVDFSIGSPEMAVDRLSSKAGQVSRLASASTPLKTAIVMAGLALAMLLVGGAMAQWGPVWLARKHVIIMTVPLGAIWFAFSVCVIRAGALSTGMATCVVALPIMLAFASALPWPVGVLALAIAGLTLGVLLLTYQWHRVRRLAPDRILENYRHFRMAVEASDRISTAMSREPGWRHSDFGGPGWQS